MLENNVHLKIKTKEKWKNDEFKYIHSVENEKEH